MLSRKLQLLISTKCTAVPHESYTRALRVLLPSEYKIATLRLSYINCLFILAFEIFSNTSFLFCSIQCMFANGRTIICSYSVRTGAMNRTPTPTECTLQLFMHNQCLFHEHVIFTHVHQRAPTFTPRAPTVGADLSCPHITECTVWITVYNQCLSSNIRCDTWLYLHNSLRTGTMNRPLRLRNVCCDCLCTTNVYSTNT